MLLCTTHEGATAGGDPVALAPGVYRASFSIVAPGLSPSSPLLIRLYGGSLTDPSAPAFENPTLRPVAVPTSGDTSVASLPILGSADAPNYWLAISLGGRETPGPEVGRSDGPTLVGPTPGPVTLATASIADFESLAAPPDGLRGIVLASGVGQGTTTSPRSLARYAIAPTFLQASLETT